jgi:hypothetical protein
VPISEKMFIEEITMAVLVTTTFVNVPQADYDAMIEGMRPMYLGSGVRSTCGRRP